MADKKWFADNLAEQRAIEDSTSTQCTLGLWGPRSRDILSSIRATTSRTRASRSARGRRSTSAAWRSIASRISYVGDPGWELYVPMADGAKLWDAVWEAGRAHGVCPPVSACTARRAGSRRLPGLRLRARRRLHRRRGRHGVGQGQGPGLRRQGRLRRPPRVGAGGEALHADDRRSHLDERHASATPSGASRSRLPTASRSSTRTDAART